MKRVTRLDVLTTILEQRVVPLFYHQDRGIAKKVAAAIANGGGRLLEFTNRGEGALSTFGELVEHCRKYHPDLIIGVGSVETAEEAALFVAHGAQFVVSPILNEECARALNRRKIAYLPGCQTLSEIARAEELGSEIVKLFPAASLGPEFIRAVLAPRPWSRIMPTGGVTLDNMQDWLTAGAAAVGLGSDLVRKEWLATEDYTAVTRAVEAALDHARAKG